MSYSLARDEPITEGIRRIGNEQSKKALDTLERLDDLVEDVHDTRKHCKKLRGLIRLVRPGMKDEYARANAAFRDAARQLSSMRDSHALLGTFDDMIAISGDRLPSGGLGAVRRTLAENAEAASAADDNQEQIEKAHSLIEAGVARIPYWDVSDPMEGILKGVAKTYGRGRDGLRASVAPGAVQDRHEWRKRVEYGWYHMRLLEEASPAILGPLGKRLHDLSDALGDDHDLAILASQIGENPDRYGGEEVAADAVRLIAAWQHELQDRALGLGRRLYVEKKSKHADRILGYVGVWRDHGEELAAGALGDLWEVTDHLQDRSRDELYAVAQDLDVAGRSNMKRNELVASVRAATGSVDAES